MGLLHLYLHNLLSSLLLLFWVLAFTDSLLVTFAFALALNLVQKNRLFYMLISNFGKKILQIGLGVGVPAVTTFALLSRPLSAMAASPSSIYDFTAKDIVQDNQGFADNFNDKLPDHEEYLDRLESKLN